jgi:hypothetical protein
VLLLLGLFGLCLALSGIVMTGSFAVAGPAVTAEQTLAYWKGVQRWYVVLALVSLAVVVGSTVLLLRRRRRPAAAAG